MRLPRGILRNIGLEAVLVLAMAGCGAKVGGPIGIKVGLPDRTAYERFWQECVEAIRQFGFNLDRVDRRAGVITTRPLTSKQWFEFWRRDVLGSRELLESSLHTVRRRARLTLRSGERPEDLHVSLSVRVERQSRPERQITTASTALQAFGAKLPTVAGRIRPSEAGISWIDLGRDPRLEAAILAEIVRRWPGAVAVSPASDSVSAGPSSAVATHSAPEK